MARIKIGGYYILDENNLYNTKEYYPVKVRVIKRINWSNYQVIPVEPIVFPCTVDGYASRELIVNKKYLSPTTVEERVVIRTPLGMPTFSNEDMTTLDNVSIKLAGGNPITKEELARLRAIAFKMRYTKEFV